MGNQYTRQTRNTEDEHLSLFEVTFPRAIVRLDCVLRLFNFSTQVALKGLIKETTARHFTTSFGEDIRLTMHQVLFSSSFAGDRDGQLHENDSLPHACYFALASLRRQWTGNTIH